MYQTRKFTRVGLSLAVLAAASGLAIPKYAKATPVPALLYGNVYGAGAIDLYDAPLVPGSPTTLTTENYNYTCPAFTCAGYGLSGGGVAKVDAGALGAQSYVSVSGTPPANSFVGANSTAQLFDNLAITGGSGSGVLLLKWTVDGSLSNSGGVNQSYGILDFSTPSVVYSSRNGGPPSLTSAQLFGDGFGSPDVTADFWIPFTFGTQFSISPALTAASTFGQSYNTTPYTAETDFIDTAAITSALVYTGTVGSNGVTGSLVNNATILSGDGFSYGPDGLSVASTAVPEPGELPWFVLGLGFLGLMIARRRFPLRRRFPR